MFFFVFLKGSLNLFFNIVFENIFSRIFWLLLVFDRFLKVSYRFLWVFKSLLCFFLMFFNFMGFAKCCNVFVWSFFFCAFVNGFKGLFTFLFMFFKDFVRLFIGFHCFLKVFKRFLMGFHCFLIFVLSFLFFFICSMVSERFLWFRF